MVNGHGTVPRVAGSCECYGVRVDVERARDTIAAEQPRRLRLDAGRSRPPEDPDRRRKIPTGVPLLETDLAAGDGEQDRPMTARPVPDPTPLNR